MAAVAFCFVMVLVLLVITGVFMWREKTNSGPWD